LKPARRVADLELDKDVEAMIARATTGDQYLLGVGKADITGYEHIILPPRDLTNIFRPVVELNFMGYASLAQVGTGLRQR
jgi:neutral ceramidase